MAYTVDGVEVGPIALGMAGKKQPPFLHPAGKHPRVIQEAKELTTFAPNKTGLTPRDGSLSTDDAIAVLKAALDAGINYWDGSDAYGSDSYNSLVLLNRYFERHPEDAGRAVVNIKGCCKIGAGAAAAAAIDCSPGAVRACVDECLRQLGGRCRLHHFEVARKDPRVAIEDTAAAMAALAGEGKIGAPGLSEVGAATVRRALAAGCRVEVVEVELSVFSTEPLTNGVARVCAENGITLLAYGHGLLTTKRFEDLPEEGDWRRMLPRFHPDNLPANRALVGAVERLAARMGCTPVQLAINWPRALSRRPGMPRIIPVVGTRSAARVADNAKLVDLTDEDLDEMDRILAAHPVKGDRYHPGGMKVLDQ